MSGRQFNKHYSNLYNNKALREGGMRLNKTAMQPGEAVQARCAVFTPFSVTTTCFSCLCYWWHRKTKWIQTILKTLHKDC